MVRNTDGIVGPKALITGQNGFCLNNTTRGQKDKEFYYEFYVPGNISLCKTNYFSGWAALGHKEITKQPL